MEPRNPDRRSYGVQIWLLLVLSSLSFYILRPDLFQPELIRSFFSANLAVGLFGYFILGTLRAITLVPLTPLLLAGIVMFPPTPLLIVTLLTVWSSSTIIYYLTRFIGLDDFFTTRYPAQIEKLKTLLKKRELPVIMAWGFTPVVPTDLIVYVCGVLRISLFKTLLGLTLGEGLICVIYIYGGDAGISILTGAA